MSVDSPEPRHQEQYPKSLAVLVWCLEPSAFCAANNVATVAMLVLHKQDIFDRNYLLLFPIFGHFCSEKRYYHIKMSSTGSMSQ